MHAFLVACGIRPSLELEVETNDTESPMRFSLRQPFAILGRHPAADVYVDADGVRPRHLYFQAIEGRIGCFNVSQTGSFATENNEVETFCWVNAEQTVNIGSSQVKLLEHDEVGVDGVRVLDPLAAGSAWEIFGPRITLELEGGQPSEGRKTWLVDRVLSLVGSASRCALQLREEGISNVHCSLVLTASGLWVVDLLGRGGIMINGQQVRAGRLEMGDELKLGSFLIRIQQSTDPAAGAEAEAVWPDSTDEDEIEDLSDIFPQGRNYQTPWPAEAEHAQILEHLMDQFQEMREPLFDQHQHLLSHMIESYGDLKGEQREALKNELERLCRISKEVESIEQAKKPRESGTRDVAPETSNPPQNGDQLSMSTEEQVPEIPASKPKSKPRSAASLLKDADTSVFRIPMKTGDLFENAASTEFPSLSDSQSWMDGETEPILPGATPYSTDQRAGSYEEIGSESPAGYEDLSNSTLHHRIDVLQKEQSSIWKKLSNFFFGKPAK